MRICLISEHASPLAVIGGVDSGGQNVYVAQVARHLVALGHDVEVFTRRDDATLPDVVEVDASYRIVHVPAGPPTFVPKEQLLEHMPQFAQACLRWLRDRPRPDVLHANFFMSGWVGLQIRRELGVPLVTTFHALGLVRREHQKEADAFPVERISIERRLVRESDRLIAECPQDEIDLARLYGADPGRMTRVPCGFDPEEFGPLDRAVARDTLGLPRDEFMVLQLGRMVPRKGIETVVRAMALLTHDRACLHVVGGESDRPDERLTPEIGRLRAVARECGIAGRVKFAGREPRARLRLWYAASDVFVTTPWYEPFGITPLEAMACERPVVGSAVGGVQYTVVDGATGLLVPPKDETALAAALQSLRADPARAAAMGRAGRARVERLFTWQRVAGLLAEVYAGVAPRRAQAVAPSTPIHGAVATRRAAEPAMGRSLFHLAGLDAPPSGSAGNDGGRPAIFLDKDGTLVHDVPYNVDPDRVRFVDDAFDALRLWRDAGYALVIVTNQSGIARGLFGRAELEALHAWLCDALAAEGIALQGFHACPHAPSTMRGIACDCRKPGPGLLLAAARLHGLDLARSWMVGDILDDVQAGHLAGCRSALVDAGGETEWVLDAPRTPDIRAATLLEAARATLAAGPPATRSRTTREIAA